MFPQQNENFPREILTWDEIDKLIDHLLPQFNREYDGLVMITRGGLIPGGMLSEAMGIKNVHTATIRIEQSGYDNMPWPVFTQFPNDTLIAGKRLLVVNDIWAQGKNMIIVKSRLETSGADVETAALHFRPRSNQYPDTGPDYYGAVTSNYLVYPWETPYSFPPGYMSPPSMKPPTLD